jgi:holo-[acyl-carrier protein] synthase
MDTSESNIAEGGSQTLAPLLLVKLKFCLMYYHRAMLVTGVDIVELDRIQSVLERFGKRFLDRIYTPSEQEYCRGRAPNLAGRFAAKEAVMKALGTGIRGVGWKEIEVVRQRGKAPTIKLHGRAAKRAEAMGINEMALSISHSRDYAIASVVGIAEKTR